MVDFHRTAITDDNFIRGAARLLWAAITQAFPTQISDIISMTSYDAQNGWNDLGATKTGAAITINNTEETFDVDQIAADIASEATSWEASVATALAEMTLEHLQLVWEGGAITTNTGVTPNEKRMGLGNPTSYVQRRLAVMHRRPNNKIRAHIFRKVQRTPQESTITYAKTGEQQTAPVRFRALADTSIDIVAERFGIILDQI